VAFTLPSNITTLYRAVLRLHRAGEENWYNAQGADTRLEVGLDTANWRSISRDKMPDEDPLYRFYASASGASDDAATHMGDYIDIDVTGSVRRNLVSNNLDMSFVLRNTQEGYAESDAMYVAAFDQIELELEYF
jgi:hypothetical protein